MFKTEAMNEGLWAGKEISKMELAHLVRSIDKLSKMIKTSGRSESGLNKGTWESKLIELKKELALRNHICGSNRKHYYYTRKGTIRKRVLH